MANHNKQEKTDYFDKEMQDSSVGEVMEYQAAPEEERQLLWKLDLLYGNPWMTTMLRTYFQC
jgi:hypothetical protein